MTGISWNRLKMTDWMAMAGAVSALVVLVVPSKLNWAPLLKFLYLKMALFG